MSFFVSLGAVQIIRALFFPAEPTNFGILAGLLIFALAEGYLINNYKLHPLFERVDRNQSAGFEIILILLFSLISGLIHHYFQREIPLAFLFICWLLLLLFYCYTQYILSLFIEKAATIKAIISQKRFLATLPVWIGCIVIVFALIRYYPTSQSIPSNPDYSYGNSWAFFESVKVFDKTGILFAIPREVSYLHPSGYGRLEDANNGDDIGYLLVQAIANQFDTDLSLYGNVRINYALYLLGSLIFSFSAGALLFRSPMAFLALCGTFILCHDKFAPVMYRVADHHGAAIGLMLMGTAFLIALPGILKVQSISTTILFSLFTGMIFGFIGLIRQNFGLELLAATSIFYLILAAGKHFWKPVLVIIPLLSLLCGFTFTTKFKDHLLAYRDSTFQIASIPESSGSHGIFFSLLGGITEWNDSLIIKQITDENPLATPTYYTLPYEEGQKYVSIFYPDVFETAQTLFLRFVSANPRKYVGNVIRNYGNAIETTVNIAASDWLKGIFVILIFAGIGRVIESYWLRLFGLSPLLIDRKSFDLVLLSLSIVCLVAMLIPALTHITAVFLQQSLIVLFGIMILIIGRVIFVNNPNAVWSDEA